MQLAGRYDLDRRKFADKLIRLDAIQHCLTYSVEWGQARKQLNLSVGLSAGF
jgi:hypothetical protein